MKISKTSRWILTIGILAILLVSSGVLYNRQRTEQSQLNSNIAQAQQDITKHKTTDATQAAAQYAAQKGELEARLNEANYRIASAQSEFRQYTESIEINKALFKAAEDSNVTITKLSCSTPADEEVNGITYRVFTLRITAEGEVPPELINFSGKTSETFSAATIESVEMTVPEVEEEGEREEKPTIDLELKIYIYEGE